MAEIKKINVDGVDYDIVGKELTKITYSELKALRDNGQLSEGHLYRITDYVTTTTQAETKSAGNVFDVVVLAVSASELSHIARAIQHEGDTYFDGNDLGAWELWYDLDNDTEKYEWADAENGKGVIYRMIDEKRNDCPYDFKNILFYNDKIVSSMPSDKYYYTFSCTRSSKMYDGTVEKQVTSCYSNSMGAYVKNGKKSLNGNVLRTTSFTGGCYFNTFGSDCYSNTLKEGCTNNTFGNKCHSNTLGSYCHSNILGNLCSNNAFDKSYSNILSNSCSNNTFVSGCDSNILGSYCESNLFGSDCNANILGCYCSFNTFASGCDSNILGSYCKNNTLSQGRGYRRINKEKTSITLNDEYYDDGSGQLVPVKHPDLSTQPSILPYKFMGQYVYEQLIPLKETFVYSGPDRHFNTNILAVDNPIFIDAVTVMEGAFVPLSVTKSTLPEYEFVFKYTSFLQENGFIKVIYTSMPEEGGDYYGYNY